MGGHRLQHQEASGRAELGTPGPVPPELEVLLALDDPAAVAALAGRVDWRLACQLADHHRLLARLGRAVADADVEDLLPADLADRLRTHRARWGRAHEGSIAAQLRELAHHLDRAGVRATLLKGGALVLERIVVPELRPLADLDLLVAQEDHDATEQVLRDLGYAPEQLRPDRPADAPVRFDRHYHGPPFRHPERPLPIEVHWQLMSRGHRHWFDPRGLHRVATPVDDPGGQDVTLDVLDLPDLLAHLALHHWYDRALGRPAALGQLWDVRDVTARMDEAMLREALTRADERGHGQVLTVVLAVQHLLVGGQVPTLLPRVAEAVAGPRVASFAVRRELGRRPDHVQLLMVTPDVPFTAWRVTTRVVAHLRRPTWTLYAVHGAGAATSVRLRQWRMVGRLLARTARAPLDTSDELRLDRWAHGLR